MCEILKNTDMKGKPNICHPLLSWRQEEKLFGEKIGFFRESPNLGPGRTPAQRNDFRAGMWNDWNSPGKCCFVHSSNQLSSFLVTPPQAAQAGIVFPTQFWKCPSNLMTKQLPNVGRGCDTTEVPSKSRASPPGFKGSFGINKEEIGRFLPKEAVPGIP